MPNHCRLAIYLCYEPSESVEEKNQKQSRTHTRIRANHIIILYKCIIHIHIRMGDCLFAMVDAVFIVQVNHKLKTQAVS